MVITSSYLESYFKKNLIKFNNMYDIDIKVYKDFNNVFEIYNEYASEIDGFLISGKFAKAAILKGERSIIKPVVSIDLNLEDIYRTIINLMLDNRDIDLNRVFFDFLIPIGKNISVESFLSAAQNNKSEVDVDGFVDETNFKQVISVEDNIKLAISQFVELKAVDLIICQFSNLIPFFEKNKIPYIYPYTSFSSLMSTFDNLINLISLDKVKENYPAIMRVDFEDGIDKEQIKCVQDFMLDEMVEYNMDFKDNSIRVFLTLKGMEKISDNFTTSKISHLLDKKFKSKFTASYSVGTNLSEALKNIDIAAKESKFRSESFVMDADQNLIGPLSSELNIVVDRRIDDDLIEVSKRSGLSLNSLQKIKAIVNQKADKQISSKELAEYLASTTRNANRILKSLETSGYAHASFVNNINTKGRPSKIYKINF